jgi:hypothetical protein
MSYTPNKNLLSSTGIAVIASLGIHGLLWAVLPGLTINSQADKSPSQRTIGLVQLSPQEQSRLPQVANPADNTLPSFATQQTELPPLPPAPPYQTSVIPPVQLSPGSAPVYNLNPNQNSAPPQTFQVPLPPPPTNTSFPPIPETNPTNSYPLPPVPQTNQANSYPGTPIPQTNQANSYPGTPVPQTQPFVLPKNNGLPNTPLTPDRTLPADNDIATATPTPQQSPLQTPANLNTPTPSVRENKLPERGKQELLAMRDRMRNNTPQNATTTPTNPRSMSRQELATALRGQQSSSNQNTSSPNTRSMSRQKLAAALRRQQSLSNQIITPPLPNTRSMSRQELAAALKRQNSNLSSERSLQPTIEQDNLDKYQLAQAEIQRKYPGIGTKQVRRKLTSCDRAIDGDVAFVGIVVNSQGKRLSEPNLITKNGKPDVVQAQNYVRNYEFAKTSKTTNYNFRLEFDYSASKCAQAKPTPAPTTNTPEPAPLPTRSIPTRPTTTRTPELTPTPTQRRPRFTPTPSPDSVPTQDFTATPPPVSSQESKTPPSPVPAPETPSTPQSAPTQIDPTKPSF